ncbi:MAG TPA: hypothetical protein VM510_16030 [Caulifigura sp.]|nr:hypothetical protein [Caulifigura sp.]
MNDKKLAYRAITAIQLIMGTFQILIIATLLFVPFGFDHPSKYGLDFDHFIAFAAVFGLVTVGQIAMAIIRRRARF